MTGGRRRTRLLAGLLGAAALALLHVPLAGAQSGEAEEARRRVAELEVRQNELALLIEETWVAHVLAEEELAAIDESLRKAESDLWLARSSVEDLAVLLYMDVTTGQNASLWLADGPERFEAGIGYLEVLGVEEEAIWNRYRSVADDLGRRQDRRRAQLAQLEEIRSQQESLFSELLQKLDEAQQDLALLQSLEAEPAESTTTSTTAPTTTSTTTSTTAPTTSTTTSTTAPTTTSTTTSTTAPTTTSTTTSTTAPTTTSTTTSTTTTSTTTTSTTSTTTTSTTTTTRPTTTTTTRPPPPPDSGYDFEGVCPADQPNTFVDTWGAPRSGGRRHQGVDLLAARGTPVRAIHDGVLFRVDQGGLGGLFIWLRSPWGDEYYYAHLDGFGPGIRTGVTAEQGDLIGYVGTSGNSPDYIPHLHFEYHPGGGSAVNPYSVAVAACE